MTGQHLEANSVEADLRLADQFDALAAAARTASAKQALERLATRFRIFAARHATIGRSERRPVDLDRCAVPRQEHE
jgi:plasmid stabilization system protein ParE